MSIAESIVPVKPSISRAAKAIAATLGVVFGLSGFGHGFFEMLQGYTPTGALYINAIGDAHLFWPQGHEPAFTLIPNFLITGIAAMLVSAAAIIWSAGFLHRKSGPLIFMLLFVLLLLVGGGVAQVIFFPVFWVLVSRIHKPLTGRGKALSPGMEKFGRLWRILTAASAFLILYTLQIAIFGYVPGVSDPDTIGMVMVSILGVGYILLILALIAGLAHDKGCDRDE